MLRGAVTLVGVICACLVGLAAAGIATGGEAGAAPVSSALVPNSIAFWDAKRGLIGSGLLYCDVASRCASGAISLTIDGGRRSRVLLRTAGPVSWVSVAEGGLAWAVVDRCTAARGCQAVRLVRSNDWGRSWQRQPFVLLAPSFADRTLGFALAKGPCEPAWCPGKDVLRSSDGGRSWARVRSPCPGQTQGVTPVSSSRAWLLCAGQPGAGNQGKAIYLTTDGGDSWQRLLDLPIGRRSAGGISSYGYALGIAFNPSGVGLLWEGRGTLYLTLDGGRNWTPLPTVVRPEIDFGSSASVVSGKAFALLNSGGDQAYRLIATTHGYGEWRIVREWRYTLTS